MRITFEEWKVTELNNSIKSEITKLENQIVSIRYNTVETCRGWVCMYDGKHHDAEECPHRYVCYDIFEEERRKRLKAIAKLRRALEWIDTAMRQVRHALSGILVSVMVPGAIQSAINFLKKCIEELKYILQNYPGLIPDGLLEEVLEMIGYLEEIQRKSEPTAACVKGLKAILSGETGTLPHGLYSNILIVIGYFEKEGNNEISMADCLSALKRIARNYPGMIPAELLKAIAALINQLEDALGIARTNGLDRPENIGLEVYQIPKEYHGEQICVSPAPKAQKALETITIEETPRSAKVKAILRDIERQKREENGTEYGMCCM